MTPLRYGLLSVASAAMLAGTLWFQRGNPSVIQTRDIVELRQAVIERCLATQYLPEGTNTVPVEYTVFIQTGTTTNTFVYGTPDGVRTGTVIRAQPVSTNVAWTNRWGGKLRVEPAIGPLVVTNYTASNRAEWAYTDGVNTLTNTGTMPLCSVVYGGVVVSYSWDVRLVDYYPWHQLTPDQRVMNIGLLGVDTYLNYHNGGRGLFPWYICDARYPDDSVTAVTQITWRITMADITNIFRSSGSTNISSHWAYFNEFQGRDTNNYGYVQEWWNTPSVPRLSHTNSTTVTNVTITNVWPNVTNVSICTATNIAYRYPTLTTNMLTSRHKVLNAMKRTETTGQTFWDGAACSNFTVLDQDSTYSYWTYLWDDFYAVWRWDRGIQTNTVARPANVWIRRTGDYPFGVYGTYDDLKNHFANPNSNPKWERAFDPGATPGMYVAASYTSNEVSGASFYEGFMVIVQNAAAMQTLNREVQSRVDVWTYSDDDLFSSHHFELGFTRGWYYYNHQLWWQSYRYGFPGSEVVGYYPFDLTAYTAKQTWSKRWSDADYVTHTNYVSDGFLPDPIDLWDNNAVWPPDPAESTNHIPWAVGWLENPYGWSAVNVKGFKVQTNASFVKWDFQYCTNSL